MADAGLPPPRPYRCGPTSRGEPSAASAAMSPGVAAARAVPEGGPAGRQPLHRQDRDRRGDRRVPVRLRHRCHLRRAALHQEGPRRVDVRAGGDRQLAADRRGGRGRARRLVVGLRRPALDEGRVRLDLRRRRDRLGGGAERVVADRRPLRAGPLGGHGLVRVARVHLRARAEGDPRRRDVVQPDDDRQRDPRRLHRQPDPAGGLALGARPRRGAGPRTGDRHAVHAAVAALAGRAGPRGRGARGARAHPLRGGRARRAARRSARAPSRRAA